MPRSARRTILVTGGAGFIGGALIHRLLEDASCHVVCLDKIGYASDEGRLASHISSGLEFHRVDLSEASAVRHIIAGAKPEWVFHLAAESHVDRSIEAPATFVQSNVVGTAVLLEATRDTWQSMTDKDHHRFIHVSTDEVFGSAPDDAFFDLFSAYAPSSPYSASKAAADHFVRAWHRTYAFPAIITNCTNNYGPYQFPEKLIPHIVIRAINGQTLPVYGDGKNVRDWLHVADHVDALLVAAERGTPGSTYLVGASTPLSNLQLVEKICDLMDRSVPVSSSYRDQIEFVEDRPGHDRRYATDPTATEDALGWVAKTPFDIGLLDTINWYMDNRDWWTELMRSRYDGARRGLVP